MDVSAVTNSRLGRLLLVLAVCACSFFIHAGAPEVSLMEARNFVAAREMVVGGSWLLPTMNHELRLAKPPLPTWCVAALQQLTGPTQNLAVLRLPAAGAATLLVLFFWGLARELTLGRPGELTAPGRTAWLATLVLASSLLVVTAGREGQWDVFATSMLVGGLWQLVRALRPPLRFAGWRLAGAGLLVGLSMLSKGPVALYALLVPFLLAFLTTRARTPGPSPRLAYLLLGGGVALVVGASWPAYVWWKVAPVALKVATKEMSSWADRHVQPFWYYGPFFAFTGLWAGVALAALSYRYARPRATRFIPYAMTLGWLVAGLVLLSLVPEKKIRYLLPLMPPLALLIGGMLRYWETQAKAAATPSWLTADVWVLRGWGSLLVLVFGGVPVALAVLRLPGFEPGTIRFGLSVLVFGALAGWVVRGGVQALRPSVLVRASLLGTAASIVLLLPVYPIWESRHDTPGLRHMQEVRQLPSLRQTAGWFTLDTLHVKQVWQAGRALPVWHPTLRALATLHQPVGVFSSERAPARLPSGWEKHVRVVLLDSFYLGRERESGRWYVSRIDPIVLSSDYIDK